MKHINEDETFFLSKERPPKKKPAVGGCITSQPDEDVPHLSEHEDDCEC